MHARSYISVSFGRRSLLPESKVDRGSLEYFYLSISARFQTCVNRSYLTLERERQRIRKLDDNDCETSVNSVVCCDECESNEKQYQGGAR